MMDDGKDQLEKSENRPELSTHRIHRVLTEAANPFVRDHIIGKHAVLPAVGVMAWTANACEQLYPGFTIARVEDFRTLKGIVFDESLADEYILELRELPRGPEAVPFEAILWSEGPKGLPRYNYKGTYTIERQLPTPPVYPFQLPSVSYKEPFRIYKDGTLFHGPRLAGVQKILKMDDRGLVLVCCSPRLTEQEQGQFPVQSFNPFAADVQFQGMSIWTRYAYDSSSLPSRIAIAEHFKPLPFEETYYVSIDVQSSNPRRLTANIAVHDVRGVMYMRCLGAEVTLNRGLNPLFAMGAKLHQEEYG
jgi:hypothetical protein